MSNNIETKEEAGNRIWQNKDLSKVRKIEPDEDIYDGQKAQKRVGVYCRVSTDHASQATSFELQKKYYVKYVSRNPDWKLVCLYSDEGISATSIKNRKGLQRMIQDAFDGKIDLIVVKSISRFCRNLGDSIRIIHELKALTPPVGIFFETEGINSLDSTSDMIIKMLSMIAEDESKIKSETITASYRQRFGEGLFLVLSSLGYRRCGVNKIEIDEEEAKTVRLIYKMYLASYTPQEIADTLIDLGRKKHTQILLDGTVKEGTCDWNASSVLNVLENEKRCGDVLAQKTYTFDCIEHIVRKNDRIIPQYYAIDQHPAIVSREDYYLALKLKKANKGGWNKGIQVLKTYKSGDLKGYVRTIPKWKGFSYADYVRASLFAYDIIIPEESLYPEYVCLNPVNSMKESEQEVEHYYELVEEDFIDDNSEMLEEQTDMINTSPEYATALEKLRNTLDKMNKTNEMIYSSVSARLFYSGDKPIMTLDRNGIKFNRYCYDRMTRNTGLIDKIEILFNSVTMNIIVRACDELDDDSESKLNWIKKKEDGSISMARCSTQGLGAALYNGVGWDERNKYKVNGRAVSIDGKTCLMFNLQEPTVIVKIEDSCNDDKPSEKNKIDIAVEEARNSSDYYLDARTETEECLDFLRSIKADRKSKAVYFVDKNEQETISLKDYWDVRYEISFIRAMVEKGITPVEGWGYLDGMIQWKKNGFELIPQSHSLSTSNRIIDKSFVRSSEKITCENYGWTTEYDFPGKEEVQEMINTLSDLKEELGME